MDMLAMRPSGWRDLSQAELTDDVKRDVVGSLESLLSKVQADQGHGVEEAYVTAVELSNAGVWESLSPKAIAQAVAHIQTDTVEALLRGMPKEVRLSILTEIAELEQSMLRPQAREARLS